ncbi:hypothetical protein Gpo141_00003505 [Globisporangium polare]
MSYTEQVDHYQLTQLIEELDENSRCGYPSKRCESARVVKRNGELHRFCDHHRQVANRNQQQLQQRKKMDQRETQRPRQSPMSTDHRLKPAQCRVLNHTNDHHQERFSVTSGHEDTNSTELPIDLTEEDLRALEELIFEDEWEWAGRGTVYFEGSTG